MEKERVHDVMLFGFTHSTSNKHTDFLNPNSELDGDDNVGIKQQKRVRDIYQAAYGD
ncbi:unnamed protein product [Dovyalis caffra]|uniref:Uncharacterized protein n=1 Tax=Dovyalis caffra TaxID=77055 RepID=A0AAV1SJG9_9ROSI|nr:unnamed protein product [Dovyalis caffra]